MASSSQAASTRPHDPRRILATLPFLFLAVLVLLLFAPATSAYPEPRQQGGYGAGGEGGYGSGGDGYGRAGWGGYANYYGYGDGGQGDGGASGFGGGGGGGGGGWSGGSGYGYGSGGDPWGGFPKYSGCQLGETRPGLSQVKQYLRQFGYLPSPSDNSPFSDDFDGDCASAVRAYQEYFHLNVTGTLDNATIELMVQPRCGMADVQVNGTGGVSRPGRGLYAYFPGNPTWPRDRTSLTYAFAPSTLSSPPLPLSVLRAVFKRAFGRWAEVTKLNFTEVNPSSSSTPDLTLGFFTGNHGDGEPFDGPLGTLAHAFSPTDGRFHLDGSEIWTAVEQDAASPNLLANARAIDLESVAVHEIGHLLGMGHSTVDGAIMYPTIKAQSRRVQLTRDDIIGIQKIYGGNPTFNGTSNFRDSTNTITTNGRTSASGAASGLAMPPAVPFVSVAAVLLLALL